MRAPPRSRTGGRPTRRRRGRPPGRPRGSCRSGRSGRTSPASWSSRSSAAPCGRAARSRAPSRRDPGDRSPAAPRRGPGSTTVVAAASVEGSMIVGARSSAPSARRSARVPDAPVAGEPAVWAPAMPIGSSTPARGVLVEGHAGPCPQVRAEHLEAGVRVDPAGARRRHRADRVVGPEPGGVGEQVADRRAGGPGRLVEVDRALLERHQHGERRDELGDRGPREASFDRATHLVDIARTRPHADGEVLDLPLVRELERVHGARRYPHAGRLTRATAGASPGPAPQDAPSRAPREPLRRRGSGGRRPRSRPPRRPRRQRRPAARS